MEVRTRRNWGVLTYYSQNWKRGKKDFFPSKRKKRSRGQIGLDFSTCPKPQRKRRVRSEMSVTPKKRKKSHLDFSLSPFRKGENSMRCCFQFGNVSSERKRIHITFLLLLDHTCESVCLMWRICLWARKIANTAATKKSTNKSGFSYDKWDKCLLGKGGPIFTSSPSEK